MEWRTETVPHTANSGTTDGRTCHGAVAHIGSRLVVDADSTMFQALSERRVAQIHCSASLPSTFRAINRPVPPRLESSSIRTTALCAAEGPVLE